jgi:hypothetical protein
MKRIYDCIDKRYIEGNTIKAIANQIGMKHQDKLSRLLNGLYHCVEHRYLAKKENAFILVRTDTDEEFECADNHNFFYFIREDYNENVAKYIYELLNNRQKTFTFKGITYALKNEFKKEERRTKTFYKNHQKIICPQKILSNKIKKNIRTRLWAALTNQLTKKNKRTFEYIGCSVEFLMGWLESSFTEGMTWENRGEWHIDHIKPCNTFDFTKEEEIYKCFHYTNLRALWAIDNLSRPKDGSDIK